MFETTKLTPVYNEYQYIVIFLIAIFLDIIIHSFSLRKYNALKNNTNVFGFIPAELMVYYRSLSKKGPFPIDGGLDSFYSNCNSWILGALIAGILGILLLLLTDLTLQLIEYKNRK